MHESMNATNKHAPGKGGAISPRIGRAWSAVPEHGRYAMVHKPSNPARHIACLSLALMFATSSCTDSVKRLADTARNAATAEEWRTWAAQVIERAKTNSSPLPPSEWPQFVHRTGEGWQIMVETNNPPLVMLVSLGGFESIGLVIGPPAYTEVRTPGTPIISRRVYPGIYVRESH